MPGEARERPRGQFARSPRQNSGQHTNPHRIRAGPFERLGPRRPARARLVVRGEGRHHLLPHGGAHASPDALEDGRREDPRHDGRSRLRAAPHRARERRRPGARDRGGARPSERPLRRLHREARPSEFPRERGCLQAGLILPAAGRARGARRGRQPSQEGRHPAKEDHQAERARGERGHAPGGAGGVLVGEREGRPALHGAARGGVGGRGGCGARRPDISRA